MASVLKHLDQLNLASAGTRVRFTSTSTLAQTVIVTALPANTGAIYIGDSTVSSTKAACVLAPGNSQIIPAVDVGGGLSDFDLSAWYFDGLTTGNKLHVGYLQKTN
jgi:hypothetical protein